MGIIEFFKSVSIKVPKNISIIGFDDINSAKYMGLTTIRQNRFKIGEKAGKLLINQIENSVSDGGVVKIET